MDKSKIKDMRVALCNRLKFIIDKRCLNLDTLAVSIGVKPNSLRRILDGRFDFSIGVFLALCDTLRIDLVLYLRSQSPSLLRKGGEKGVEGEKGGETPTE